MRSAMQSYLRRIDMITPKQIQKFKDRLALLLNETVVKAHTSHSKGGKTFNVRQHDRQLKWGAEKAGMIHSSPSGRYTIGSNKDGTYELWKNNRDGESPLGKFNSLVKAKKFASKHFAGKTLI